MPQLSLHSPLGPLTLSEEDGKIVALDWGRGRDQEETPLLLRARAMLDRYFDGEPECFDLPLAPFGTPWRQRVWEALRRVPYGTTVTYQDLARQVGGSPRAIGGAMAANPIPILIPCHRVLGKTGLGGYSGTGGLDDKRALLSLEGVELG
ncbi:methylated-DNA--[protein]-cysteine S-methyltransferase [Acidomonas methanolica]|uniref:methylated-DNA--[protein]-cysteine S-methyltransferase n=1 Tax=Acidomonas methanolica TaxID=437 RepID=UPI00211A0C3B|nr:methylated-DNA--[protein]-cysteine S-methyltransferase [Acidomonas methanolica]MCQ9154159.1 methylated-DNA--[protein]-cysteine S-methyltransferase [Acidomonas methanolica]